MLATLTAIALVAFADTPARKEPPPKEELAAITERGRNLAGYDSAAWHASDAVQALQPKEGSVARYIAHKTDKGWEVAFGRLDEDEGSFLVAYLATQGEKPSVFVAKEVTPPRKDKAFFLSAARAMEKGLKEFTDHFDHERRLYNVAVLPAEKGQFWVYVVPAPTKPGVWPLGGDIRYLISADGKKIVAQRRLHNSILEVEPPPDAANQQMAAGYHTHVLDDVPEDTDVFHVLTRKPTAPELIATQQFVFQVNPDGTIKYLGKAEDVLKLKQK